MQKSQWLNDIDEVGVNAKPKRIAIFLAMAMLLVLGMPHASYAATVYSISSATYSQDSTDFTGTTTASVAISPGDTLFYSWCFTSPAFYGGGFATARTSTSSPPVGGSYLDSVGAAGTIPVVSGINCQSATSTNALPVAIGDVLYPHLTLSGVSSLVTFTLSYLNLSTTPGSDFAGPTHVIAVEPFDKATAATNTPFTLNAIGWLNSVDIDHEDPPFDADPQENIYVNWRITALAGDGTFCSTNSFYSFLCSLSGGSVGFYTSSKLALITTLSQSFDISSTSPGLPEGVYQLTTSIFKKKSQTFFEHLFSTGETTLAYKTTSFFVGSPTAQELVIAGIGGPGSGITSTTTAAYLNSCIPIPGFFHISDCVHLLFVPQELPNWGTITNPLSGRSPFVYFFRVGEQIGSSTSATSSAPLPSTFAGATIFEPFLKPLRDIESVILWILFAFWAFNRLRHWEFQA